MKFIAIYIKLVFTLISLFFSMSCYAGGFALINGEQPFVFGAAGMTETDVNTSLAANTTLSNGALDDTGKSFEVGVGYTFNKRYFITLGAQKNKLQIADINKVYGSINYQFPKLKLQPYIGLLAGYSELDWSKRPHTVLLNEDLTSTSSIYGIQAGIEKKFSKKYSIFMKYQYIKYDHRMEILNNTSNINHDSEQNLMLGLRYFF